jgi:phosphoglucomutase
MLQSGTSGHRPKSAVLDFIEAIAEVVAVALVDEHHRKRLSDAVDGQRIGPTIQQFKAKSRKKNQIKE